MERQIMDWALAMNDQLVADRRDFHAHAETGWLEMRTTCLIARRLRELGYQVLTGRDACLEGARMGLPGDDALAAHAAWALSHGAPPEEMNDDIGQGYTGAVGLLHMGEGPVVALRFDIDALGMVERHDPAHRPFREGFASVSPGMTHACGHDGHAAIGLGVAALLVKLRPHLKGTVKLLFQPGEEGARGAAAMVAHGHLDDVDYFVGSHIAPTGGEDDGDITPATYGSLATTKYDVTFTGKAAHAGGYPEQGDNALLAAATAVLGLHAIPRHSGGQSRVNVGTLSAGTGRNVIPDSATLMLEVRGETTQINQEMARRAQLACQGAAQMQGCQVAMVKVGEAEGQVSDLDFARRIAQVMKRLPLTVSSHINARNWGSEDISIMMNRVQRRGGKAVYMRSTTPMASPQHTVAFDFDEGVLSRSAAAFAAIAYDLLQKEAQS